ncbi:hypothetical protein [Serratia ureilytica]|uniref:hypothetical protein n=1 Tax=Serratia ureilytica TaxID=300181 RepID=UPI0018D6A3BC|nr:hypothetical protein [Serratia ureilytica]MBH2758661.1 hypothetical protein [Serratia ureilytica]
MRTILKRSFAPPCFKIISAFNNDSKQNGNKMTTKITYQAIADRYGYDVSTVSRDWKNRGFDITKSETEINKWIIENIIKPLRSDESTKVQIEKERLRELTATANIKELDEQERRGELINVAIVESELAKYFHQFKTILRSIPSSEYLKLFESKDAITLKNNLQEVIDNALREIGSLELSGEEQVQEDLQTNNKKDTTSRKRKAK